MTLIFSFGIGFKVDAVPMMTKNMVLMSPILQEIVSGTYMIEITLTKNIHRTKIDRKMGYFIGDGIPCVEKFLKSNTTS